MYKLVCVALAVALAAFLFASPTLASDPTVIDKCRVVVTAEQAPPDIYDHNTRGTCVQATINYLKGLKASGLEQDEFGIEVASLVVDLSEIVVIRSCRQESEVLEAMRLAADTVEDPIHHRELYRFVSQVNCPLSGASPADGVAGDSGIPPGFVPLDDDLPFGGIPASYS